MSRQVTQRSVSHENNSSEVNVASAISLSIQTDKSEYQYSDLLSFVIQVSDVTGKPLTLHIRDESGKNSAPIVLQIVNATTTITARESFDHTVYKQGVYYLDVEYSGAKASTSFKILGTDMIVIPSWVKNLGKWWSQELVTDKDFARGIEYLIKEKNIIMSDQSAKVQAVLPRYIHGSKLMQDGGQTIAYLIRTLLWEYNI